MFTLNLNGPHWLYDMDDKKFSNIIVIVTTLTGLVFLIWWITYNPVSSFAEHHPGEDNRPESMVTDNEVVEIGAYFASFNNPPVPPSAIPAYNPLISNPDAKDLVRPLW